MALFTGQIHKYGCALIAVLSYDENTKKVIIVQNHKSMRYNVTHTVSAPEQLRKCSGAASKCSGAVYECSGTLICLQ